MKKNKKEMILNGETRSLFLECTEKDSGGQDQISRHSGECGIMERKRNECLKKEALVK